MNITEFSNTLTRITAGGTGSEAIAKLNAPLSQVETALNTLATRISELDNKSAIIRKYVPLASTVTAGSLVYYDTSNQRFEKAIAALLDSPGDQGQSVEAESARVEGLVVSIDSEVSGNNNVYGTLLMGGYWEDGDTLSITTACLGASAVAGTYYLSPSVAGTATRDPGSHLRQPIITYHGGGKLNLSIHCMAHDNHFHTSSKLTGSWTSVSTLPAGVEEAPEGTTFWYSATAASDYVDLGELSDHAAVFYNGILNNVDFIVSSGYLWTSLTSAPTSGSVTVFNHYPFAYGSPVLRGIESTNAALTITTNNGLVSVTQNDFVTGMTVNRAAAVADIAGNTITYTPVVSGIVAGPGTTISRSTDGICTISTSDLVAGPVDAYSINYNGASPVSDGTFIYITFPGNRTSSIIFTLPVSGIPSTTQLSAVVWGQCVGTGGTFSAKAYWLQAPTAATASDFNTTESDLGTISFVGATGKLTYAESSGNKTFYGNGQLVGKLTITTGSNDVRLFRVGFKLSVVAVADSGSTSTTPTTAVTAVENTLNAATNITRFQCVRVSNSALVPCRATDASQANSCVGIAKNGGAAGTAITYVSSGMVTGAVAGMTPGAPLYVGTNGMLTSTPPLTVSGGAYNKRVATAITATDILVNMEPAITAN